MSPKLPVVSADELIRAPERCGYMVVRQKGSHIRLRHATDPQRQPLSVPQHKTIKIGLLRRILRDARLTVDELNRLL
jgi:predicted RNA binding protein YcfA (HicA-like mRNA interferase family)